MFAVRTFARFACLQPEENMRKLFGPGLGMIAGIAIGAAAIQGLHAQAKAPAYVVVPILKITDSDAFKKVGPIAGPAAAAAGGHYLIRGDKITPLDGTPPARLVVIAFDSVEKAQAFANSDATKQVSALRAKSTKSLSFIIEGTTN